MISEADISHALGEHLKGMPGDIPIAWENRDHIPKRPYFDVQVVRVSQEDMDLKGGGSGENSTGFFQVTIVTELGKWAYPAERLADKIKARFLKATRLVTPSCTVKIVRTPDIKQGFRDGPDWRLPIQIHYRAN